MMSKSPIIFTSLLITSLLNFALASPLDPRDSSTGRCGAAHGGATCLADRSVNLCCSQYGWCGDSTAHCGDGCQAGYGNCRSGTTPTVPATSANPTPTTPSTTRSKPGSVPYGASLYDCTVAGKMALTYDDGPWEYTSGLLDILANKGVKATFFITGNNLEKGAIDSTPEWTAVIRRAYNEGHQIASHTWDHADLDVLSEADRRFQMTRNEQAFMSILGFSPTYMRPPYIRCEQACLNTMGALGYHVIIWDLNTDDYNNVTPELIQNSKNLVRDAVVGSNPADGGKLSIAHDIHYQTVYNLTSYQIDVSRANGYELVRLGECFNDPAQNWYRTDV